MHDHDADERDGDADDGDQRRAGRPVRAVGMAASAEWSRLAVSAAPSSHVASMSASHEPAADTGLTATARQRDRPSGRQEPRQCPAA